MRQIIYLIRHGHTSGTENNIMYGSTELPVTEDGLQEIRDMAARDVYPDPEDAVMYTSGMLRTEQTFEAIYGDAEHSVEPLLREIDFGRFEMMTIEEILADEYGKLWLTGEVENPEFEGGDTLDGFITRVNRGLKNIIENAKESALEKAIAVIHGGVMSYLMQDMFPDEKEDMWDWTPYPGCGYVVELKEGKALNWKPIGVPGGVGNPVKNNND